MRIVGEGTRILNFLVDTAIVFGLAYFAFKGWNWYVLYWGYKPYKFGWFFFSILFVYYFLFEGLFSKTPGKWISFSRVSDLQGRKASIGWIFIRSLTRIIIIDLFFIPFLGKPLHDHLSKTTVIES